MDETESDDGEDVVAIPTPMVHGFPMREVETGYSLPSMIAGPTLLIAIGIWLAISARRRRWPTLSLRALFVLVTAAACWLGWELKIIADRRDMVRLIRDRGGYAREGNPATLPLVRRLLGDRVIAEIEAEELIRGSGQHTFSLDEIERIQQLLEEADCSFHLPPIPSA